MKNIIQGNAMNLSGAAKRPKPHENLYHHEDWERGQNTQRHKMSQNPITPFTHLEMETNTQKERERDKEEVGTPEGQRSQSKTSGMKH